MNYRKILALILLTVIFLVGCAETVELAPDYAPSDANQLTIYTSHKEEVYLPIVREFESRTGIWVRVITGGTNELLEQIGQMPLPPYIKAELQDQERYQTVYSREVGSAAAPTAGLHWTNELLEQARAKGVRTAFVTLHVGLGTFRPVQVDNVLEHHMHSELCMMSQQTAEILNQTKKNGGRVICVGTTSCRTLESLVNPDGTFEAKSRWTDIFIYPGYAFKAMDGLITNFHLPESTLVMLVSAFAGRDYVLNAYNCAVAEKYRFFSFGDAMAIL